MIIYEIFYLMMYKLYALMIIFFLEERYDEEEALALAAGAVMLSFVCILTSYTP